MVLFSRYHLGVNQKVIGEASNLFGEQEVQNIVGELEQPFGELLRRVCYMGCYRPEEVSCLVTLSG